MSRQSAYRTCHEVCNPFSPDSGLSHNESVRSGGSSSVLVSPQPGSTSPSFGP